MITYETTTENTGSLQINVNGLGNITVKKWLGTQILAAGDIPTNIPVPMVYDGTYWEVLAVGSSSGGMVYPAAGVPCSTGSSWCSSYSVGLSANNLVQLNSSAWLPFNRLIMSGASLVTGDFSLGSGWGSTATVSSVTGTDEGFNLTVNSTGTGQAINPTITFTYHQGAFANAPIFECRQTGGTGVIADVTFTNGVATTTTLPMIWNNTPIAGLTYIFSCIGLGR